MNQLTMLQRFAQAKTALSQTTKDVSEQVGCSREYIYKVIKWPDMNRELYGKICEYVESAGIEVPAHEWEKSAQPA